MNSNLNPEQKKARARDLKNNVHKSINYYVIWEFYGKESADKFLSLCRKDDTRPVDRVFNIPVVGKVITAYYPTKESVAFNKSLRA